MVNIFLFIIFLVFSGTTEKEFDHKIKSPEICQSRDSIVCGDMQTGLYVPLLNGKRVTLVVNHTAQLNNTHLVDSLMSLKIKIIKIFAPEHGFRGLADSNVKDSIDINTKLPIISLYGNKFKPTSQMLKDVDIVIFDIQDVGTRFYTYLSTLHYVMEACAENQKKLILLDRPNPNGDYFDGPVLNPKFKSFVGMHPIPIVHGCTFGELAQMINGEGWLANKVKCDLLVIPIKNYNHKLTYSVPVKPSPNLPNDLAIRLYPSLCLFEGTPVSVGRGTEFPFQVLGYPDKVYGDFTFTPLAVKDRGVKYIHEGKVCYGIDLRNTSLDHRFSIKYIIDFYNKSPNKIAFFRPYFNTLAGTDELQKQIKEGWSDEKIRNTWQGDLKKYGEMRKKYLIYCE